MKLTFLAQYPLIGTKHKPSAMHLQERSPYYWWWAYLQRNTDYIACCERNGEGALGELYADFGDIRHLPFREWWGGKLQRGGRLFAEQSYALKLNQLKSKDEWFDNFDDFNIIVVAVNLGLSKRGLQKRFADLLKKVHTGTRGRKALSEAASTAKYPLFRNFAIHNLKTMLFTYDAWHANAQLPKSQQLPMWAIGESIKLVPSSMPSKGDTKYVTTAKRNIMSATVSRYVKNARTIIANTSKGQFPKSTTDSASVDFRDA